MGAVDFYHESKGSDPSKIFDRLCRDAARRSGNQYSGEINMKKGEGFRVRKSGPLPLTEARDFADEDTTENPKWGPAYCVPFYTQAEKQVDEIECRLGALSAEKAKEKMIERAKNKVSKVRGAQIRAEMQRDFKQTDKGTLPELRRSRPAGTERDRSETWLVKATRRPDHTRLPNSGISNPDPRSEYNTESEARDAIKDFYRKFPETNGRFVIKRRWTDEIEHFAPSGEEPSSNPMWEGTVKVIQTKDEDQSTEGYIFYGMASY